MERNNVIKQKKMKAKAIILLAALAASAPFANAQEPVKRIPKSIMGARISSLQSGIAKEPVGKETQPTKAVSGHYTYGTVLDGDTIPLYYLREVKIYADGMLLSQKEIKNNAKLIRNVRLMLPYAKEGKRRLDVLEVEIAALPRKQRKAAIKEAEQKLLSDYKGEISNYTFSQGLVLIKLIDRETNRTAYKIVGELRGSLRAGLYQTLAKLFGYNLKDSFDPKHNKKDDLIDRICISIERGQI